MIIAKTMFFKVLLDMRLKMRAIFTVCLALVLGTSMGAYAQTVAPQPCDPAYWNTLTDRAWLEAEREIMQNQNLIFKPDSVFEYTCFDRILAHTATHAGAIFSHTSYFGSPIIPVNDGLGLRNALGTVVYDALKLFINDNFDHEFLGGRAGDMSATIADTNMNLTAPPPAYTSLFAGSYGTCQIMSSIWQTSKCANFIDNSNFEDTDGFYPLDTLQGIRSYRQNNIEARQRPAACGGASSAVGTWSSVFTRIETQNRTSFETPLRTIFTDVYNRTEVTTCGTPIRTGVTVYSTDHPRGRPDAVCTNPGCTYQAPAGGRSRSGGNCVAR